MHLSGCRSSKPMQGLETWDAAEALARQALQDDPKIQRGVCLLFKRVQAGESNSPVSKLLQEFNCGQ